MKLNQMGKQRTLEHWIYSKQRKFNKIPCIIIYLITTQRLLATSASCAFLSFKKKTTTFFSSFFTNSASVCVLFDSRFVLFVIWKLVCAEYCVFPKLQTHAFRSQPSTNIEINCSMALCWIVHSFVCVVHLLDSKHFHRIKLK